MQVEELDNHIRTALGRDVKAFSCPEKLSVLLIFLSVVLAVCVVCGVIDGSITRGFNWMFAVGSPVLIAFIGVVGWYIQFRKPYLAVGSNGVAFPLACGEVIPWSNIKSIDVFSDWTFHGRRCEHHVAVALKLKRGSLDDYGPTWRSLTYIFGYRSHYVRNIVLLSTIYCAESPEEVRWILLHKWRQALQPWGRVQTSRIHDRSRMVAG